VLTPRIFYDERGFFFESYKEKEMRALGIPPFVQDNHSFSKERVIRGMHFQTGAGQAKLVRVAKGKICDVIVDIREDSPTFKQWETVILDDGKHEQLFVPVGFAHGFQVLSETAHVLYKVSTPYQADLEKGFRFNDLEIGVKWPLKDPIVSDRDRSAPLFSEIFGVAR